MPLHEENVLSEQFDARVPPSPLASLGVYAVYLVTFLVSGALFTQLLGDVDYDEIAANSSNFFDGVVIPIGAMAIIVAIMATALGWWRPALFEQRRTPNWMLAVPIIFFIGIAVAIGTADLGEYDGGFLALMLLGFAFVGFSEELVTRGLILVGFRAQFRELYVWLFSTLLFSGMHSLNAFSGQDIQTTAIQVGSTFFTGSILYLIRRTTGTLIVSMVAHALFDFSVTVQSGPGSDINDTAGGNKGIILFIWAAGILGLIGHRHLSGRNADSAEQLDTAPASP